MAKNNKAYKGKNNKTKDNRYDKGYDKKNNKGKGKDSDPRDMKSKKRDDAEKYSQREGRYVNASEGSENDPSWYTRNRRLADDVGKISFFTQLGREYILGSTDNTKRSYNVNVPGIMRLEMVLSPGTCRTGSDAANLAAQGVFQYMRKDLSTYATYAPADVFMSIMAIDSVYSMYSYILRLFGIVNAYSADNLFYPKALVRAGYNFKDEAFEDLVANLNNYRARFNNLIYRASTLYLPTDFTITERHAWLFTNYFLDHKNNKGQIYIHVPRNLYYWDETSSQEGTQLTVQPIITTTVDMRLLLDEFQTMIDVLRNSDSFLKIQADMRRAFQDRTSWKLAYCDEGYMCLPTSSDEVLSQIENMTINTPYISTNAASRNITQDVDHNIIYWDPNIALSTMRSNAYGLAAFSDVVLNMHWENPTTDDILVATRDTVTWEPSIDESGAETRAHMRSCGSDFCVRAVMFKKNGTEIIQKEIPGAINQSSFDIETLEMWSAFDWAPALILSDDDPEAMGLHRLQEYDNYVPVDSQVIAQIHNNVIMSMWSIPELGAYEA